MKTTITFRFIATRFSIASVFILPLQVLAAEENAASKSSVLQQSVSAGESMSMGYLGQLVVGLLVVLLCIVALAWLAKRFNRLQSTSDGSLRVIGGLSMGARERIVLVQVGDSQLLLGVAPGRVNTLHVLAEKASHGQDPQGDRGQATAGFAENLATALKRGKS